MKPRTIGDFLILVGLLAIFAAAAIPQWHLPGLYYDEALDLVPAMQLVQGKPVKAWSEIQIGGLELPLMTLDYVGPTSTYLAIPFFAILGPGVLAVRSMEIAVALAGLVVIYFFTKEFWNRSVAVVTILLLAISPSYIFWGRMGVPVSFPIVPISIATLWAFWRWQDRGSTRALYAAAFLIGLGLATKLTFIWFLLALFVGLLFLRFLSKRRESTQQEPATYAVLNRKTIGWSMLLFGLGGLPLWVYNFKGLGTLRAVETYLASPQNYGVAQLDFVANLGQRLKDFFQFLDGGWFYSLGGTFSDPLALPIFLAACLYLFFQSLRDRLGFEQRKLVFVAILLSGILLASVSIVVPGGGARHLVLLFPYPQILVALAFVHLWQRAGTRNGARLLAGMPLLVFLASQASVVLQYHYALADTGGVGHYSDAIYDLEVYLEEKGAWNPAALDWGFAKNLEILSQGEVNPIEIFGFGQKPYPCMAQDLYPLLRADPQRLYLFHSPGHTAFPGRKKVLEGVVESLGNSLVLDKTFYQRNGPAVIEVYRLQKGTVAEIPPIQNPLDIAVGEYFKLLGYRLDSTRPLHPGDELAFTLYWRSLQPTETSFHVFTHLVDAQGKVWAQKDNPPMEGCHPTDDWVAGEVVIDPYTLALPAEVPAGVYQLLVGMYDPETLERLPIASERAEENSLLLTTIQVAAGG